MFKEIKLPPTPGEREERFNFIISWCLLVVGIAWILFVYAQCAGGYGCEY